MTEPTLRPTPEELVNALYSLKAAPLPEAVELRFICGYGETAAAAIEAWSEKFGDYVTKLEAEVGEAGEGEEPDEDLDYGTGFIYWKSELAVYESRDPDCLISSNDQWVCRADLAVW